MTCNAKRANRTVWNEGRTRGTKQQVQARLAPSLLRLIPIQSMRHLCGVAHFVALRHSAFWTREWG